MEGDSCHRNGIEYITTVVGGCMTCLPIPEFRKCQSCHSTSVAVAVWESFYGRVAGVR